ncbi:MAG: FAD-dependent monooxygenase [Hyphomicrobiales bacterium]|nr:FAD-dependent monooxygenase [Hyphomicrobiales bacterium]
MELIIIGGGIGGLTLALAAHAAKPATRIRVFEAAPEIRPLGVGINLGPHAVRELSSLGLQDALAAVACQPQDHAFFTRHGQLVYREPWGLAAGHRWPHLSIHRADLHQVLLSAVQERLGRGSFITGRRCVGIEQHAAGVTARLVDDTGATVEPQHSDVLVACDGVHSAVHMQFNPDEGPFVYRGTNMWRGVTRRQPCAMLLGGAAHPIYPQGDNGGAQAIIDAATLARLLAEQSDPIAALKAYEEIRLPATSRIVLQNRTAPPNVIVDTVEQRTGGERFDRLEDVISQDELRGIFERYQKVAGYHVQQVGKG